MAIPMFLAMTADEIRDISPLPSNIAYLGCYFSSHRPGLEGLPNALPPGSGLILDDRNPIPDSDPAHLVRQLSELTPAFGLLDFQRTPTEHALKLAAALSALPCPTAMPPAYGKNLSCPLFLPPIPPHIPVSEYLEPWHDREIWLELALDAAQITITAQGSQIAHFPHASPTKQAHTDSMLHCHYQITRHEDALEFYCYRTREDIAALLAAPLPPNVTHAIGLYQELREHDWYDK